MPEIKNQFTGGKMNKDIDERLVPKGEYKDAMNIQVSTSEGSEVGTVQNILGNIEGCSYELIPPSSFTVGSVADEKNDTLYWLVSGQYEGVGSVNWNQFSSVSDMIIRKTPTKCEWVFVDQYAITTTNNTSNNFGSVNQISGLTAEISNQIEPGWTVTGLTGGGDTSNTVNIVSVTPSPNYTANQNFHPNIYGSKFIVPLDSSSTMQAGNVLYVADYDPLISMNTYDGMSIRLFQNNHPDDQMNTVATGGAQLVTFTRTTYFQNSPSISSTDTYLKLTLTANMTVFAQSGNFDSITYDSGDTLSRTYDGSIIWGQIDFQLVPHNFVYHTVPSVLQPGDPINFGSSSGCVGYVNNSTLFTMVDCSTIGNTVPTPIQLPSFGFSFTLPLQTTILLDTTLNLSLSYPLHDSLIFEKPRVLNFDHDDYITGINIIDDMLFWTDGKTEPKKINIPRSVEGTQDLSVDANGLWSAGHTRLMVEGVDKGPVKEEHITVIRKAPLRPPHLEIKTTAGEGVTSGAEVVTTNTTPPFDDAVEGELVTLTFNNPDDSFGFKEGDIILLSSDIENLPDDWEIRASIESITSSGGISTFIVKIEAMAPLLANIIAVEWFGRLEQEESLFQRKLPRFAYRYKYEDGEYSSFSPFTEVAFLPGDFSYQPIEAFNKGVVNSIKSLKIQNFITQDIPLDVVSVDLLYKNETNPSIYLLKSISPNDIALEGATQNYWNTPGSSLMNGASKGSYEVSSENITLTLPSSQSLRAWDNVPKKALAQEITGNRIVYGNYVQGYDTIQPDIQAWLGTRGIDTGANVGEKSVKSLRDYDIGVIWGDKYGRETPVKTSGESIKVPKSKSINSSYINAKLKNSPDWADYYRFYIKETSNEYYNLAVDRVYDAADGNVWVSFPSVDRNKVDEDTYIILKKGLDSNLVNEEARYKIVAIENEAPEYIKTTYERLMRSSTDGSKGDHSCNLYGGEIPNATCDFPGGANAPKPGRKGFSINAGRWSENVHQTVYIQNVQVLGMALTSPKTLLDEVSGNTSGSTTDELYVSFSQDQLNADGIAIPRYSDRYHVINVDTDEVGESGTNYYYVHLDRPIVTKDGFITDDVNLMDDGIHIHFWKKTIINKPEFDGRFFVKIKQDTIITNKLIKSPSASNELMELTTLSVYKIADNKVLDNTFYATSNGKYLFHTDTQVDSPGFGVSTHHRSHWESLLKFGSSSIKSRWFIDNATFASKQNGSPTLPSGGKLSYSNVTFDIGGGGGDDRHTCDTTTYVSQKVTGLWWPTPLTSSTAQYTLSVLAGYPFNLNVYSQHVGDGKSNGLVAMRGIHTHNSKKYIDLAYSQFGPDGPGSDGKTQDYNLDWRIGVSGNSSTDQELDIVSALSPESLFRVTGSDIVYKILAVQKHRLFNYHGAKRSGLVKVSKGTIPFHGTLWNTTHKTQVQEMRRQTNRRITYRIEYEVSETFSKDAYDAGFVSTLDAAGEPMSSITPNGSDSVSIQFLTDFMIEGENPISKDPAIFETEPKEEVDIDIYYEASSSLPTLPLKDKNKHLYIPIGATIVPPAGTDFPEGIFITSWESINPLSPLYVINLSAPLESADLLTLLMAPITYIEKDTGEIVSCKVGGAFTVDPTSGAALSLQIIPKREVGLNWFNCWSFNNGVESNRIGDTYNKPYITNGVTASSSTEELKEQETRKNGLIYSGIYNSTSEINNLNQFIAAEKITKDINPIYGSIQKLKAGWGQGGDLITLCEDRVLKILANKDALFNADGNSNITSTNNVLGQAIPYSGEYGISRNPESFASEAYRIYFTDKVRGTVMRLSMDGLTPISSHGMKDWFRDHLKLSDGLMGSYDDKKDEYNILLANPTRKTVTFREDVRGWVSFKSFLPENAISCASEYYTFKDGKLWKHHAEQYDAFGKEINRNTFYGMHNSNSYSTFTAVLNDVPGTVKSFNTINYEGSDSRVTANLLDDQYYNLSPKPGWYVDSLITNKESGSVDEFIEKEGKWFNYIKGENIQHSLDQIIINPDGSSTFDHASFAIQGIGRLSNIPVNIAVQGCTDASASNYDSNATIDNGSCIPFIYGCLHPSADNYDSNANTDSGNCTWTGCTCNVAIYPNGCTNTTTFPMEAVNYQLPTVMPINPPFPGISDDGSCTALVYGCTNPTALNYNAAANTDDGSCTAMINGCATPTASNYDSSVTTDNGTCIWYGCQDATANNYYATTESATWVTEADNYTAFNSSYGLQSVACTYNSGCTDSLANNYDATATTDDGSCGYCGNIASPIPTPDPNNALTLTNTYFTASVVSDETTSGANDGVINIDISLTSPYGNNGVPTLTHSNGVSYSSIMIIGQVYVFSGLPSGVYDLTITQGSNSYVGNQTDPCLVSFNALLTVNPGLTAVLGCTDASATNYDASATVDDGSCTYTAVNGCTDPYADNQDTNANTDDGSCDYCGSWAASMSDMFTVIVTDESVAGANDGYIEVQINPSFTDYGFGGPGHPTIMCGTIGPAHITLYDTSPNQTTNNATANTCIGTLADGITLGGAWNNLPASNYDIVLRQGGSFLIGNQNISDLCSWTMSTQGLPYITIAAGAQATGCTDSIASNYDANAVVDDGSCIYASGTFQVGDSALGGIIGYIFQSGDPGYIANEDHGIVVEVTSTQGANNWGCDFVNVSGLGDAIGDGQNNTATIIAQNCTSTPTVANLANNHIDGTYTDWFLPSINELVQIHNGIGPGATGTNSNNVLNDNIGNFSSFPNWSSSQATPVSSVHVLDFSTGVLSTVGKTSSLPGRYARYF